MRAQFVTMILMEDLAMAAASDMHAAHPDASPLCKGAGMADDRSHCDPQNRSQINLEDYETNLDTFLNASI
jgi:hypothetical protein